MKIFIEYKGEQYGYVLQTNNNDKDVDFFEIDKAFLMLAKRAGLLDNDDFLDFLKKLGDYDD